MALGDLVGGPTQPIGAADADAISGADLFEVLVAGEKIDCMQEMCAEAPSRLAEADRRPVQT